MKGDRVRLDGVGGVLVTGWAGGGRGESVAEGLYTQEDADRRSSCLCPTPPCPAHLTSMIPKVSTTRVYCSPQRLPFHMPNLTCHCQREQKLPNACHSPFGGLKSNSESVQSFKQVCLHVCLRRSYISHTLSSLSCRSSERATVPDLQFHSPARSNAYATPLLWHHSSSS